MSVIQPTSNHPTHAAVAVVAAQAPLQLIQVPTVAPAAGQVRVEVHWVASSPFDLHQAEGGFFLLAPPQLLGDTATGVVVEAGEEEDSLKIGDEVFCALVPVDKQPAHQEFITVAAHVFGKIPSNTPPQIAATIPSSFITTWHTLTNYLSIPLPFPKPSVYTPPNADAPILIWGAFSSVGQYVVQILKHYGYTNIVVTASKRHHDMLRSFGARETFDYTILEDLERLGDFLNIHAEGVGEGRVKVLDGIGSLEGSMEPLARMVPPGSLVAVLLPVIKKNLEGGVEYLMETQDVVSWKGGVETVGVRTHFYQQDEYLRNNLQPVIMPAMLEQGVIKPNRARVVEGRTFLERAQNALDMLRRKEVSGERLVWRVKET
ncbi:chaperonin 10-like protein [Pterulicium gracile]|uniref:Chaperonin 10-like protein n=1 Tax=Pterulicium gracile TaxID=1884261 RepID=A0A5C3QDD2_9AGAR|nr:chaperonin 10-like protein [Pterula gracilis]